jgi:predicted TIM-barrel fold metal-dependent hydrolase
MLADLCPNVYLDTSSPNDWMKYQAGQLDLRQVFRHTLDVAGPHRLLFGSDSSFFPRGWQQGIFEAQATALYELGVSEEDAKAIFGENLLRILAR